MEIITVISGILTLLFGVLSILLWRFRPEELKSFLGINRRIKPKPFTYGNDDFAHDTIRYRFRNILNELDNYYEDAVAKIYNGEELREMIQKRPFSYDKCMSVRFKEPETLLKQLSKEEQNQLISLYNSYQSTDKTNRDVFIEAPFINVEHFFYYYILDVFYGLPKEVQSYMSDNENGLMDPYKLKKKKSIKDDIGGDYSFILECLEIIGKFDSTYRQDTLNKIVKLSLDTNSCDLSQLGGKTIHHLLPQNVYPYEKSSFVDYFLKEGGKGNAEILPKMVVNYLVDNGSVEFFSDLTFAFVALNLPNIKEVNFYVNKLPIFVSDVIGNDYPHLMKTIRTCVEGLHIDKDKRDAYIKSLDKINKLVENGKINIISDFVWNMPTAYRDLDIAHKGVLKQENAVLIIKGDLNFRRLVDDKNWFYTKSLENISKEFISSSTLVIRSFKSDLVLDYKYKRYWDNNKKNRYWRENGEYGTIRFLPKK